ncbi:TIGR03086 family metal-binding protein [Nonomuraea sp. ATR24]|uniref:TIGR03086 family metal-binding protein n=1 Tax=Nonomuraea sp. ATR24 TaxID=1676744 RepID=UPI0035C071E8
MTSEITAERVAEIAARYRRRADAFERKVVAVRPGQWDGPTPCAKWTVLDVLRHIIDMHAVMLRPFDRGLSPAPPAAEDPVAAYRAARADVEAILADPALAGRLCDTPAGRLTAAEHIDQVVSADLPLHGWDLAVATSQDATIDPEDVEQGWAAMRALPADLVAKFREPGAFGPGVEVFGPEVPVGDDASTQDRLLAFIGRDPHWHP